MNKTQIEWVKNPDGTQGYTFNPITGCLNHDNGMCRGGNFPCYAYKLAHGRLKNRYLAQSVYENRSPDEATSPIYKGISSLDPFYPRFWPERLENFKDFLFSSQWRRYTSPVGVFVCDMADLFGIGVPKSWTEEVLQVIRDAEPHSSHRFYLLTKQPQNLPKFSPFPDNCWVGVTGTNYQKVTDACGWLDNIQAKVKYISIEPLLSWNEKINTSAIVNWISDINWLIIGAQTRPTVYPNFEWAEEIAKAADQAGIPVFVKNNMNCCAISDYPKLLDGKGNLRQEMPNE